MKGNRVPRCIVKHCYAHNPCHSLPGVIQFQTQNTLVSRYRGLDAAENFIHASFLLIFFTFYIGPGTSCLIFSQPSLMSVFTRVDLPLQSLVKMYLGSLVYPEMTAGLLRISVMTWPVSAETFLDPGLCIAETLLCQNGMLVHLKRHLSFLCFRFTCLHTLRTLFLFHHSLCSAY